MSCFLLDKGEKGKREKGLDDVVVGVIDDGSMHLFRDVQASQIPFSL